MKIQNINSVNFANNNITSKAKSDDKDFRNLSEDDKLLVIYDMLKEQKKTLQKLSYKQYNWQNNLKTDLKTDLKTLSANQYRMFYFHKVAFDIIASYCLDDPRAKRAREELYDESKKVTINIVG